MTREELLALIAEVQDPQSELADVEAKAARAGTPQRLFEPLSAFANRAGGGVVSCGPVTPRGRRCLRTEA